MSNLPKLGAGPGAIRLLKLLKPFIGRFSLFASLAWLVELQDSSAPLLFRLPGNPGGSQKFVRLPEQF